jgi:hypothetical protein
LAAAAPRLRPVDGLAEIDSVSEAIEHALNGS